MENKPTTNKYKFDIGEVIYHLRYGYRGVIIERDPLCKADDKWYYNNKTQPKRQQPWYHVLVHDAEHSTYVAESHLKPETSESPIDHPYVNKLFKTFLKGRYYIQQLN